MQHFDGRSEPKPSVQGTAASRAKETVVSDARERRIAELREQYSEGAYEVDAAKVSAKIVERHLVEPTS